MLQWSYWLSILFHHFASKLLYKLSPNLDQTNSWFYSFGVSTTMCLLSIYNFNYLVSGNPFDFPANNLRIALNFYLGYLVADAWRIWNYSFKESQLYFYHHLVPSISCIFLNIYHFHYVLIAIAESNIPFFCFDMGLGVFLKEIKSFDKLHPMIKKPLSIFKDNHSLLKKIDAWWYLASRVVGIGGYILYLYLLCGWDCQKVQGWRLNLLGLFMFWFMFVIWCSKMMRRAYGQKPK